MHVVSVAGLTKAHDDRVLLDGVTFGLTTDDHVGIVGPNGSGKTTLLKLLAGAEPADAGRIVYATGVRVGYLAQDPDLDPAATALQIASDTSDRTVREHEVEALLDRLGVDPEQPVGAMSGGQRRRVSLARTLVGDTELLLLDEPTNHLDVDTIDWLEEHLRQRPGGLVMVTHDRYFLERLTDRMLELEADSGDVHWHEGTYADLLEARAERAQLGAKAERRRQNLLRKEVAWLRRGPKARTSKPKFRVEQAQDLMRGPVEDEPVQLQLGTGRRRLGTTVVEIEDAAVRYGDTTVLEGITLGLAPGQRLGVVGPNGSGKTTLLKLLAGELEPDEGRVEHGTTVEIGFYRQDAYAADPGAEVLGTIIDIAPSIPLATGETLPAHRLAERFGFPPRLQRAEVRRLSGGERRRLALLHTLVAAPNVLILDEPTNDLDLDTLAILEDHLDGFGGTLIVASHDRYVLDRLTDELVGVHRDSPGLTRHLDWEDYRQTQRQREDAAGRRAGAARGGGRDGGRDGGPAADSAEDNRRRQARMRDLRSLEQRMEKLTDRRDAIDRELAAIGADYEAAAALDAERRDLETELADVEDAWLELAQD